MPDFNIDLRETKNSNCLKVCNKEDKKEITEDTLCTLVKGTQDNLPVRCVGEWAKEKIIRLVKYLNIFATGMKNKWDGKLNYVEICSGPGSIITIADCCTLRVEMHGCLW